MISLKHKLWQYLGLFAVFLMLILWIMEIIFLKTYYETMKAKEIVKLGNKLVSEYGKPSFGSLVYQLSYGYGMMIRLFDEQGNIVLISNNFGEQIENASEGSMNLGEAIRTLLDFRSIKTFVDNMPPGQNYVSFPRTPGNTGVSIAVFGSKIQDTSGRTIYFLINSPITQIETNTSILQTQLVIVTGLALLLSSILSYFIAKRLSEPISNITRTARRLGEGKLDVVFENGGYSEVDELANVLNFATRELSRTDELRRDLMANVSHDLRTPLTIIKSYAEMIRDISGDNKEKRDRHTSVIIDETDRLSMLVNDILDLSKLESGTEKLELKKFNISDTVKSILLRFSYLTERDGYILETEIDEESFVTGDERKLEQVIYNLIGNAINYTGEDKCVRVKLKRTDKGVRFCVCDTGKGIPKEDINRVWERYYTKSHKHSRSGFNSFGTGVGLSIVKNILTAHNAQFGIISEVGKGSEFWFEIV